MADKDQAKSSTQDSHRVSNWAWLFAVTPLLIAFIERWQNQDIIWFRFINKATSGLPDQLWAGLSLFGNGWACFALAFPLLFFAPRIFYAGLFSGLFTSLFAKPVKLILNTPRPAGLLDPSSFHIIGEHLYQAAIPSGHTTTAFAIATAIYLSINKSTRFKFSWIFILPTLTGISRIAVGAHWPEDVLVGMCLGILSGILGVKLANLLKPRYLTLNAWPSIIVIAGSFICCFILLNTTLDFELNSTIQYILVAFLVFTWSKIINRFRNRQYV
jgi:membrane-associated phospholipid phosphatase